MSTRVRRAPVGFGMALPALVLLTCFVAVPFLLAVVLSFTDLRMGSPLPTRFVGLEQYRRLFADTSFLRALANNAVFAAVVVPVQTAAALGLALLLNRPLRARALLRTLFFLPVVFPMALIAVVWQIVYAPGPEGVLNTLLAWTGGPRDWLHDPTLALPSIMLLSIWQGVGFQMVVLLAGLQAIPRELYDAAAVDRAGRWSRFVHVTLPQLRNPLVFTTLITTILAFRVFDQVQILTQGGPLDATTTVLYDAVTTIFRRLQVGRACAMVTVFFAIVVLVTWVLRRLVREERSVSE